MNGGGYVACAAFRVLAGVDGESFDFHDETDYRKQSAFSNPGIAEIARDRNVIALIGKAQSTTETRRAKKTNISPQGYAAAAEEKLHGLPLTNAMRQLSRSFTRALGKAEFCLQNVRGFQDDIPRVNTGPFE